MQIFTDINELVGGASIVPQTTTVSVQGVSVDMFNADVDTNAIVEIGTAVAAITGITVQIEEWNGTTAAGSTWTAIPNMIGTSLTTGPSRQLLLGLRTQRYARANLITAAMAGTVGPGYAVELLGMPKSSGGASATGFSRSPSS